jgi:hypothetical protein
MVTQKQMVEGWTNIRVSEMTVRRLRVLKAQNDYSHFDELINKSLDLLEGYDNKSDCFASSQPSHKSKKQHTQTRKEKTK